jgi:hypothetical protein
VRHLSNDRRRTSAPRSTAPSDRARREVPAARGWRTPVVALRLSHVYPAPSGSGPPGEVADEPRHELRCLRAIG